MARIKKVKPAGAPIPVPEVSLVKTPERDFTPEAWMPLICEELEKGLSLYEACSVFPGGPAAQTVLSWVQKDREGVGVRYARAREVGYHVLGDRINLIASETHTYTLVPMLDAEGNQICDPAGNPRVQRVLVPLNSDVVAMKRLQLDTLKWQLSKMLPKIYGDKVTQEHTGAGGGPIAIASVDLRNLSDTELENMQLLMAKASGTSK